MVSLLTKNNVLKMYRIFRPALLATLNQGTTVRSSTLSLFAFGPTKPFVPVISSRYLLKDSQIPCYRKSPGIVSLQCLEDMLKEGDIQLFDVREPDELQQDGKIPGSVNLPVNELSKALALPREKFLKKYGVEKPVPSDENIVFYCRSGKRAEKALKIARRFGYTQVNNYNGGWLEWKEFKTA